MIDLVLVLTVSIVAISAVPLIWYMLVRSKYSWLANLTSGIIYCYPFERIPSYETQFGPIRPVQLLVISGFILLLILFFKKDPELLQKKIHPISIWICGFFILSLPSLFQVQTFSRFLSSYFATLIAFGATFLIANFGQNLWRVFVRSCGIFVGILLFSYYQFVGDLIKLPGYLTGIKPIFASNVFGFPRIHATFNEPAYYANALFLFIFSFFFLLIFSKNVFKLPEKPKFISITYIFKNILHSKYRQLYTVLIYGFILAFIITIAKSSWIVAPFVFIPALIVGWKYFDLRVFLNFSSKFLIIVFLFLTLAISSSNEIRYILVDKVFDHLSATLNGNSATAQERNTYLDSAIKLLPHNILLGIGPGQYGTYAQNYILSEIPYTENVTSIITFNVYAEVWLEYGLLAFIIFLYIFFKTTFTAISNGIRDRSVNIEKSILQLSHGCYLLASLIQWNWISPIYVYPIFISLGILLNLNYHENTVI